MMESFEFMACLPPETKFPVRPDVKELGLVSLRLDCYGGLDLVPRLVSLSGKRFRVTITPEE